MSSIVSSFKFNNVWFILNTQTIRQGWNHYPSHTLLVLPARHLSFHPKNRKVRRFDKKAETREQSTRQSRLICDRRHRLQSSDACKNSCFLDAHPISSKIFRNWQRGEGARNWYKVKLIVIFKWKEYVCS